MYKYYGVEICDRTHYTEILWWMWNSFWPSHHNHGWNGSVARIAAMSTLHRETVSALNAVGN